VAVEPKLGQLWEEVDRRKSKPRLFAIVGFDDIPVVPCVSCVRFYGITENGFAPDPKTGRKPRRFSLHRKDLESRRFTFTGKMVTIPENLPGYPPTKSHGLR
jgi:hypothetical protein